MIAAFMIHGLGVAALCAFGAWAAERALAQLGGPRRLAWASAMPASVVLALLALRGHEATTVTSAATGATVVTQSADPVMPVITSAFGRLPAVQAGAALDRALALAWAALSAAAFVVYLLSARRLAKRARSWTRLFPSHDDVLLADDIGPAVFGLWRSRVVLPRWLSAVPAATQKLVLEHETQHVRARDPQLLALGLAIAILFPWNLPLLWQWRRLRFALEVDCDARVLAAADPTEYGEALLLLGQHVRPAPAGAMTLIERPSQLERRIEIMTAAPNRFRRACALAALGLAALCLLAASSLQTPALAATEAPLKPTPGAAVLKLGQYFERMLVDRFPDLLEQDHPGTAMVVVLLNDDWSIARAVQVTGREQVPVDERTFGVLGIAREDVPYVGNMGMQSPGNPKHVVLIVYTERKPPGKRFVSHVFPDTRAVDREIYRHYFPDAVKRRVPAGQRIWVLLDREGHVLRSGQEALQTDAWTRALEARFPGIGTQEVTLTPITDDAGEPVLDAAGHELQLNSVWLAPGSPPPRG